MIALYNNLSPIIRILSAGAKKERLPLGKSFFCEF
jgi:hypothetical protein